MEDIVKEYIDTKCSIQFLAKKYKKDAMAISRAIKKAGYEVVNRQNLIKINEHIFDTIDTEEKAYWLGFIWADGALFKNEKANSGELSIELQLQDKEHLKTILNFYRNKGFLIALDDVGEGYSSLNMIIDIKPDIIKVDRNIIENIDTDTMKQSIYKALRTICVDNNIKILAEGVETPYELEKIKEIGVDYAQGYYFAKPSSEIIRII